MRQVLPTHAKISDKCKELMLKCSVKTDQAIHQCQLEHRRITAENLINAMDRLGYQNNAVLLTRFLQHYCTHNNNKTTVDADAHVAQATTIAFATYDVVFMLTRAAATTG